MGDQIIATITLDPNIPETKQKTKLKEIRNKHRKETIK